MKEKSQQFIEDIKSDKEEVQLEAWTNADQEDPEVILPLSELLVSDNIKISKAADEALKRITHSVGKKLEGERWEQVVGNYVKVLEGDYPTWSKGIALRHLSKIGKEGCVESAVKLIGKEDLREEVVFCLERIPGKKATMALVEAVDDADEDFKPRILVALGKREDPAGLPPLITAMGSDNNEIAITAMKAVSNIGKQVDAPKLPEYNELSRWKKFEYVDSWLRYCDKLVEKGNTEDTFGIYRTILENSQDEHFRCAAVVSLSKMGISKAKNLIQNRVENDPSYIVQITAKKALETL